MVGRTRLIRTTGSPLIGGSTSARRRVWRWLLLAGIAIVAGVSVYLLFLR